MALEETRKLEEQYYVIEQKSGIRRLPLKEIYYFKKRPEKGLCSDFQGNPGILRKSFRCGDRSAGLVHPDP